MRMKQAKCGRRRMNGESGDLVKQGQTDQSPNHRNLSFDFYTQSHFQSALLPLPPARGFFSTTRTSPSGRAFFSRHRQGEIAIASEIVVKLDSALLGVRWAECEKSKWLAGFSIQSSASPPPPISKQYSNHTNKKAATC